MMIALDIETSCAVPTCPGRGGSSKCKHALSPWTANIDCVGLWAPDFRAVCRSLDELERLLCTLDSSVTFVAQNGKFDFLHLRQKGVDIPLERWSHDTHLMAYVHTRKIPEGWLWKYTAEQKRRKKGGRKASQHSLKTLAPYFLGVEPFWEVEDKDNDEYVLKDCEYTYRLAEYFAEHMTEDEWTFYEQRLLPWTKMLLQAEGRGVLVDWDKFASIERDLEGKKRQLEQELDSVWKAAHKCYVDYLAEGLEDKYQAMAAKRGKTLAESDYHMKLFSRALEKLPAGVNYASPSQMMWLFRDYFELDVTNLEGKESTGVAVLEEIAASGREDVGKYLEWRKAKKLLEYMVTYRDIVASDGAIHASFNPTGTRTGRLSSSNPNLQQVNKKLKPIFRARPGYKFIGYDLASIEAKLIAFYSEDKRLYSIVEGGGSLHDHNVKVFFGYDTPTEDVKEQHPVERAATKNVGFALFYGAGKNRIKQTFQAKGFMFDDEHCGLLLEAYKAAYPAAFQFHRDITGVFESGEVVPNLFGRPIKIQDPEDAYMKGFNTLVQGSASDLTLEAAHGAIREMREKGIDAHLLMLAHDFIGVEAEEERAAEAEQILVKHMTSFELNTSHGPIKLGAEGYVSGHWED